jgi:[ribulose-bisphosphate carboxylase]-lysine N-methyltransferase
VQGGYSLSLTLPEDDRYQADKLDIINNDVVPPLLCVRVVQGGYSLSLTLPEDDRYYADKLDILERNGLGASASFSLVRGQEPTPEMMGFLRLMQLNGGLGGDLKPGPGISMYVVPLM